MSFAIMFYALICACRKVGFGSQFSREWAELHALLEEAVDRFPGLSIERCRERLPRILTFKKMQTFFVRKNNKKFS
jgi:hypothetical protein